MLSEIVLDTNVMLHADDPREQRRTASTTLLVRIIEGTVCLCVDEGFHVVPAKNRSHIGSEYLERLHHGSMGLVLVVKLVNESRIVQLPRRVPQAHAKRINQLIRNPTDRTFLKVAYNSGDKVLVSHDYKDFQEPKRRTIKDELGVRVIDAAECHGELE